MAPAARAQLQEKRLSGPRIVAPATAASPNPVAAENPSPQAKESLPRWAGIVIATAGTVGLALGLLVVIGWHTGHIISPALLPLESVPVRYNAGLCFIFAGVSLLLLAAGQIGLARLPASALALLGVLTGAEYVFEVSLGIDGLFFDTSRVAPAILPRMAPNTAFCFSLLGATLLLSRKKFVAALNTIQAFAAALMTALALVGLIGYLAQVPTAYAWGRFTPMAAPTAGAIFALGLGAAACAWRQYAGQLAAMPPWAPLLPSMTVAAVSGALWQALHVLHPTSTIDNLALGVGLLQAALLFLVLHFSRAMRERARQLRQLNSVLQMQMQAVESAQGELRESQSYTRSLIEASLDPLVTIAPDGKITDVNAATEAATGCSRLELIGTDFCDYFTDPARARAGYQQVFAEGRVRDYALEIRHRDGRVAPVLYNASVYHDQAGNVIGVFAAARDISELKRAEQALRRAEERYRALLVATAQVVWTTPSDGLVEDMPMWRDYTGQSLEQVRGWGWLSAIHPDDREATAAIWSKAVESHGLYETEYRIRRADGQYRHFAIRGVPVLEDDGSIREWVGACTDIHQRKQIEDELRQQAMLLNLAHDAIVVFDLQYRIAFWNRGAEETYGWSAKEAVGRIAPELLGTEFPLPLPEIRAAVQQQGEWEGELKHRTRGGRTIVVASRWSLQRNHHGAPASILEINRDVTERKRLEEELRLRQFYTRSLIEASLDPLVTISSDGKITDVNRATEAVTGVERTQLVGSDFSSYFTDPEKARAGYQQVFAAGMVQDYPLAIRHRSGQVADVLYNASVFRNEAGEVKGVFAAARDVTERKRAEEELRLNRERLQLAQKVGRSGTFDWDIPHNINSWSPEVEALYGLPPGGFAGTFEAWERLLIPADLEKARANIAESLKTGEFEGEWRIVRPGDGQIRWVAARAKVLFDQDGQPSHMIGINIDVTERKLLEESLRQRTLELENSVSELEAFSYSVSHDLRAPLRSIDGFSQILLEDYRDKVDAEGQDSLRRIRNASQNMGQLIDALLQLSRVMRSELSREPVDLSVLALSTAAVLQKGEPSRRARLRVTSGLEAHGDRRLLSVLLQNLLQNAWKFTAPNPTALVEFGSTQKDGKTAFYVRDNGVGFDMTYVNKLFTPFQRLHAQGQFQGTGIGLATVQRIIKRHGGRVWAEGAVGKGATFYFSLE